MNENSLGRAFRIFLKDNGLYDNNSIHTLRHTFISYMLEAGVPIKEIQKLDGHSSLKTTLKYIHAIPSEHPSITKLDYFKKYPKSIPN